MMETSDKKNEESTEPGALEIWQKYERGLDYGRQTGRFTDAEKCWRFFEGDQWNGIKNADGDLPFYNIIRPVVNYKKARIAMNSKNIHFSTAGEDAKKVLDRINEKMREAWEFGKMDTVCWDAVERALVAGDAYLYFPDGRFFGSEEKMCRCNNRRKFVQILDGAHVFLGDEEEEELQNQPYIIVEERRLTEQICREARENGIGEQDIDAITPDRRSEAEITTGNKEEQQDGGGKSTSLLYLERTKEGIRFCRVVRGIVYQPFRVIAGLQYYPLAAYTVNRRKGKARGYGEVLRMIPNQIEINRTLVRRSAAIKMAAFPKLVYNSEMVANAGEVDAVGAAIELTGAQNIGSIAQAIGYIQPAPISSDAVHFEAELISNTKELAGAGDAALGNINPEQASGAAITAVQDQADIPMNREISAFTQLIEDIAIVWYHLIVAYNPLGYEGERGNASRQELEELCPSIRIDISSEIPNTVTARVNTLYNLLSSQMITFDEFLELIGSDSNIPVGKLKEIREEAQREQERKNVAMMEAQAQQIETEGQAAVLEGAGTESEELGEGMIF